MRGGGMKKRYALLLFLLLGFMFARNKEMGRALAYDGKLNSNGQPENVSNINKNLQCEYKIETFPYFYSDDSKGLIEYYMKVMDGDEKTYYYLTLVKDNCLKQTIYENEAEYLYFGNLKKSYPEGKGILFKKLDITSDIYYLYVVGNFDRGYIDGYALWYDLVKSESKDELRYSLLRGYEGEYKKGELSGNGIAYAINDSDIVSFNEAWDWTEDIKEKTERLDNFNILTNIPMVGGMRVEYIGEFGKDDLNGKGTKYGIENQMATASGEFKNRTLVNGKIYSYEGSLLYEGELKNGKYHGKGILYNSDGSVKYEGKFKNGDIK